MFATFPAECQAKKESSKLIINDAELVQLVGRRDQIATSRLVEALLELKMTEDRPRSLAISKRSRYKGLKQGMASRSARPRHTVFRQTRQIMVIRDQAADQLLEHTRALLSGGAEFIVGQLPTPSTCAAAKKGAGFERR